MKGTIESLFEKLGYDYNSMEVGKFYPIDKTVKISTIDLNTGEKVSDIVRSLVYKGKSKGYYVCVNDDPLFRCTPIHKFYDAESEEFKEAKDLYPEFIGVDSNFNNIEITLIECDEEFPVLDLEVENNHSYLANGILSHNTFGGQAALCSNGLRGINPYLYKYDCSLIMISQERQSMSLYGADYKATSGQAVKYYSSWIGRVTRTEDLTDKQKGLIGIKMKCKCLKSKLGPGLKREAFLNLYFDRGIDSEDEYLDYLKDLGIIEQRSAWYYNEDWGMKVAGKNGVAEFLHNNPELYEKVKQQVNEMICGYTILDEHNDETSEEESWEAYKEVDETSEE